MLSIRLAVFTMLSALFLFGGSFTLTVNLKGLKSDKGMVDVALYNDAEAYPTKPDRAVAKLRSPIANGAAVVEFKNLDPGTYAVAAYHDVNDNGKLDANFIGIPKEPTGASNDAKGRMGPPSFKDAQFALSTDKSITISMQ
jgi:uncharacterized protein (DUF2141 family)